MQFERQRELIDKDHAGLARLAAKIAQASQSGDFRGTQRLLLELQSLEESHYAFEDEIMHAAGYEMHALHRAEHAELIDTLRAINRAMVIENLHSAGPQVAAHLEAALDHMQKSDARMWAELATGSDPARPPIGY